MGYYLVQSKHKQQKIRAFLRLEKSKTSVENDSIDENKKREVD